MLIKILTAEEYVLTSRKNKVNAHCIKCTFIFALLYYFLLCNRCVLLILLPFLLFTFLQIKLFTTITSEEEVGNLM